MNGGRVTLEHAEAQGGPAWRVTKGQAQILWDALGDLEGIAKSKMFGGLCFMLNCQMLCGVHAKGGMARVGKTLEPKAPEIAGTKPLDFTGPPMGA